MLAFIAKTLGDLLLTKSARDAIAASKAREPLRTGRDAAAAAFDAHAKRLIPADQVSQYQPSPVMRSAMRKIVASLDDETKLRRVAEAVRHLMNEGKD